MVKSKLAMITVAIGLLGLEPAIGRSQLPVLQKLVVEIDLQLEERLGGENSEELIVALVVEGDSSIREKESRIVQEIEKMLNYRMENSSVIERVVLLKDGPDVIRNAQDAGAEYLFRCLVGVEQNTIQLVGELTPLKMPFWERLADPAPKGIKEHLFVSGAMDVEIRLLLKQSRVPPTLGNWHLDEWLYVPLRILDVGVGNVDGEPGSELVLLGERSIEVYTLRQGKPALLVSHRLSHLPENKLPVRDPSGNLLVVDFNLDGQCELFYRIFNLGFGEILSWQGNDLRSLRQLEKVPVCVFRKEGRAHVIYGSPEAGTNRYLPLLEDTDINSSVGEKLELPEGYSTFRCWQSGENQPPLFVWVDLQHRLTKLDPGGTPSVILERVGDAMGIVDFDRDEKPELVCSDPVWPGEPDNLRVVAEGEVVWQSKSVVGSIAAITGGDLEGSGKIQAVIIAWEPGESASRIYLLQR